VQIDALDAGAHDYISASMAAPVFMARLRAALRGGAADVTKPIRLDVGDVALDLEAHSLFLEGAVTKCPPLQFTLLVALARVPNRVVDRATLASVAWGPLPEVTHARRLRVAISVLRSILGTGPGRPRIESVSNVGYRLVVEHREGDAA
jgi:DNA-binding response OmpR family regulator